MTQKLMVIQTKALSTDYDAKDYLSDFTKKGWRIVSVSAAGAGQETYRSFLVAVVLEKTDEVESNA